ncbi:MAG: NADAR family protein [Vulcanimicrobiota bacterium]
MRNLAELLAHPGPLPKFLFFWGHQPRPGGGLGPGCLSQWWPSEFRLDGVTYSTAEHYMMAEKARLFGDHQKLAEILASPHPHRAKSLGAQVAEFDEATWQAHRFDIVVRGNLAKFSSQPDLTQFLMATGQRILVEASPRDRIWGIGLPADHPDAAEPARWRGQNLLGFALMEVRARLA